MVAVLATAYDAGVSSAAQPVQAHPGEEHSQSIGAQLNWLRAAVLGANDGIVSVAGIVVGVAGATTERQTIVTAGIAGLVAGALSMAAGEYVSVSTQRDTELALLDQERRELREMPARGARRADRDLPGQGPVGRTWPARSPRSSPSTTRSRPTWTPSSAWTPTT